MASDKEEYIKYNKLAYKTGLGLMAFCLSWLSPLITALFAGNNLVEIFLIPAAVLIYMSKHPISEIVAGTLKQDLFRVSFFIVFLLTLAGLINSGWDFPNVYGDFRANFFLIFAIFFFSSPLWSLKGKALLVEELLVMITIMDVLALILRPYLGMVSTKQTISIIAPSILAIFYIKSNNFLRSFVFTCIVSYEAIVAFYRNYYIIAIVVYLLILIVVVQNLSDFRVSGKVKMKSAFLVFVMVVGSIYASAMVYNYWMSDSSKMVHSINRTEEFLEGGAQTEKERTNSLEVLFSQTESFIVPKGLGWKAFQKDVGTEFKNYHILSTMDSCPFYIAYHYSIFILIIVLGYGAYLLSQRLFKVYEPAVLFTREVRFLFLLLFLASFFTQGVMFATMQGAFVYGLFYALVIKPI